LVITEILATDSSLVITEILATDSS
jgi:hypothetical protein